MNVLLHLILPEHSNRHLYIHLCAYMQKQCRSVCLCIVRLSVCGLERPQKNFYECETLVKQVYLGQMGEQDIQLAGRQPAARSTLPLLLLHYDH